MLKLRHYGSIIFQLCYNSRKKKKRKKIQDPDRSSSAKSLSLHGSIDDCGATKHVFHSPVERERELEGEKREVLLKRSDKPGTGGQIYVNCGRDTVNKGNK